MKWGKMREIQRNALMCEKIFGWQWIPYTFRDVSATNDQVWLLPDRQSVADLTPGEWTYYEEDEQGNRIGNRYIPYWIPHYTTSMDAAWQIFQAMSDAYQADLITFEQLVDFAQAIQKRWDTYAGMLTPIPTAEDICIDALRAIGEKIEP